MEKCVFGVICGVIGAAIGSIVTYFVVKNKVENEVKTDLEATFAKAQEELKKHYEANFEPKREPVAESILMKEKANLEAKLALKEEKIEDKLRYNDGSEPINYTEFYKPDKDELEAAEQFYLDYSGLDDGKHPVIIPRSEYDKPNGFNKLKLIYYEESGIFAHVGDSSDSGFTEEYFGLQNLGEFGNIKFDDAESDPYTLFFRDEGIGTDFEVYYEPNETYDEVLERENKQVL